jgi:ferredoxin
MTHESQDAQAVYEKLATHLDALPAGFARTNSGVEMRILRRLFTPQEAKLALHLTIIPEEARVIARRAGITVAEAASRLDEMDRKGLIMRTQQSDDPPRFMALQWMLGFWEGQVNRLTPELVEDALEYESSYIQPEQWGKAPQMRTIPVQKSIEVTHDVMPYEMAEEVAHRNDKFGVANCICRTAMQMVGKGCDKPRNNCLAFGPVVDYLVHSGRGREIGMTEALDILQQAEREALVLQPDNAQEPLFICACCGCCCGVLRILKRAAKPSCVVASAFSVRLDSRECNGCGVCIDRCQMDAISICEKKAVLNVERCIGCGLCVTICPTQSLSLVRKPVAEQMSVPKDHAASVINVGRARGRLSIPDLVRMQIKSKWDRLMASK